MTSLRIIAAPAMLLVLSAAPALGQMMLESSRPMVEGTGTIPSCKISSPVAGAGRDMEAMEPVGSPLSSISPLISSEPLMVSPAAMAQVISQTETQSQLWLAASITSDISFSPLAMASRGGQGGQPASMMELVIGVVALAALGGTAYSIRARK